MQFDASQIGLEYDLSGGHDAGHTVDGGERRKRAIEANFRRHYNPYLQQVLNYNEMEDPFSFSLDSNIHERYRRDVSTSNDRLLKNLPINRTIYFDCQNAEEELCLQAKFTVLNFKADKTPIFISLNFSIDLSKVGK